MQISVFCVLSFILLRCDANIRSKRVVGGEIISISNAPWMAMLVSDDRQFCGATIISANALLTGATCLNRRSSTEVTVIIGVNKEDEIKPENRFSVKSLIMHPDYDSAKFKNDVGIVIVDENIDLAKYVKISLPSQEQQDYEKVCVAGWGFTSEDGEFSTDLRKVCFTSKDFTDCLKVFPQHTDPKKQICVGAKGKDACNGDAGGPLYTSDGGKTEQIGIVSWGKGCGALPGVYTRVSEYIAWIQQTINV